MTDVGQGIVALDDGDFVTTGYYKGSATFGLGGPNETFLTSAGAFTGYLARFHRGSYWQGIIVRTGVMSAAIDYCEVDGGSVLNEYSGTTITNSSFSHSGSYGLKNTAGGSLLVFNCTATYNSGDGLDLLVRPATDCISNYNGGFGIYSNTTLTNCAATGNRDYGLNGMNVISSVSDLNVGTGIIGGNVTNSAAVENRGNGIETEGGVISGSTAIGNGGSGIYIGFGYQFRQIDFCTVNQNLMNGISIHDSEIGNTTIEDNIGEGVMGLGGTIQIDDSRIIGNSGQAMSGVAQVNNSAIASNGGGIFSSVINFQIKESYIGNNDGDGLFRGIVQFCSIVANNGNGVTLPSSIWNSWIVDNSGVGLLGDNTIAPNVNNSSILGNKGGGLKNLGDGNIITCCSIFENNNFGNVGFEVSDDQVRSGFDVKRFENNFWGPAITPILTANPFPTFDVDPEIIDGFDGADGWFIDYTPNMAGPIPNTPDITGGAILNVPAIVLLVSPDTSNPVNAQLITFTFNFSEPMDTAIDPEVTFALDSPFTLNVLEPLGPGWMDPVTWKGVFDIDDTVGDGTHTLRISGATALDGFLIPDETSHQFIVDTSGGTVANNGLVTTLGATSAEISWNGSGAPAETVGYNVVRSTNGAPGSYEQINGTPVPGGASVSHTDNGLSPSTLYFWKVYRVNTSSDSEIWSGPVFTITDPGPTVTPSATPSPTPTGTPTITPTGTPTITPTATATSIVAGVVFVDLNAPGPIHNGNSWATAYLTVQEGISSADLNNEQVWVADETYNETVTMADGVEMYGGFEGFGGLEETLLTQRDVGANVTTIDAGGSGTVVTMASVTNTRVDGFTITGGNVATHGGGISCVLVDNTNTITNCAITGNSATLLGGGVYCEDSSPNITNTTLSINSANSGGAVSCTSSSNPDLINCTVSGNSAANGGGIYCISNSDPTITNTIFEDNTNYAIYESDGSSDPFVIANLFFNNSDGDYFDENITSITGATPINLFLSEAIGNVGGDPKFMDKGNDDFHIQTGSAALDKGISPSTTLDYEDDSRGFDGDGLGPVTGDGSDYDIGADEYVFAAPSPTPTPAITQTATPTSTITGTPTVTITPTTVPFTPTPTPGAPCPPLGSCLGDADRSGFVDINDFAAVQLDFGAPSGPPQYTGDADCSLFVDINDFAAVQFNFGAPCS